MDSLKVSGISFANYGIHIADVNMVLQMLVAIMTIIYLAYKIIKMRKD